MQSVKYICEDMKIRGWGGGVLYSLSKEQIDKPMKNNQSLKERSQKLLQCKGSMQFWIKKVFTLKEKEC